MASQAKAALLALGFAVLAMAVAAHEGHDHATSPGMAPSPGHQHDNMGTSAVPSVVVGALMILVSLLVFGKNAS